MKRLSRLRIGAAALLLAALVGGCVVEGTSKTALGKLPQENYPKSRVL